MTTWSNFLVFLAHSFQAPPQQSTLFIYDPIGNFFTCLRFAFILFLDILKSFNLTTNLQKLEFIYTPKPNNLLGKICLKISYMYLPFLWSWGNKPLSISFYLEVNDQSDQNFGTKLVALMFASLAWQHDHIIKLPKIPKMLSNEAHNSQVVILKQRKSQGKSIKVCLITVPNSLIRMSFS